MMIMIKIKNTIITIIIIIILEGKKGGEKKENKKDTKLENRDDKSEKMLSRRIDSWPSSSALGIAGRLIGGCRGAVAVASEHVSNSRPFKRVFSDKASGN